MKIRLAKLEDADAISALITNSTKKHILPDLPKFVYSTLLDSMLECKIICYMQSDCVYHVAEECDELIGAIAIKDNSHIFHLFVADKYRGRGVARDLWENAKVQSIVSGNLSGFTVNSAIGTEQVYLKFGFRRIDGIRERDGVKDIPMQLK